MNEKGTGQHLAIGLAGYEKMPSVFSWIGKNELLSDIGRVHELVDCYSEHASRYFNRDFGDDIDAIVKACHEKIVSICDRLVDLSRRRAFNEAFIKSVLCELVPNYEANEHLHARAQAFPIARDLITLCQGSTQTREKIVHTVLRERFVDNPEMHGTIDEEKLQELAHDAFVILYDRLLDVTLRPEAFHMAARYWEGRYIQESLSSILMARTESNVEEGLRRLCMVTPCLVSTVNSVGRLFKLESAGHDAQSEYLLGAADLLIMDEAGQIQQRMAMPILALTKKALIVGDIQQLQPVITDLTITDEASAYYLFPTTRQTLPGIAPEKHW